MHVIFAELLVDATQAASGPVGPVLVVDNLVTPSVSSTGGPGPHRHLPVGDLLVGMLTAPYRSTT